MCLIQWDGCGTKWYFVLYFVHSTRYDWWANNEVNVPIFSPALNHKTLKMINEMRKSKYYERKFHWLVFGYGYISAYCIYIRLSISELFYCSIYAVPLWANHIEDEPELCIHRQQQCSSSDGSSSTAVKYLWYAICADTSVCGNYGLYFSVLLFFQILKRDVN